MAWKPQRPPRNESWHEWLQPHELAELRQLKLALAGAIATAQRQRLEIQTLRVRATARRSRSKARTGNTEHKEDQPNERCYDC